MFAGGGFIFVAPDYPGLGDSAVPRHRYFNAQAEARSAADLLVASRLVLHRMRVKQSKDLFTFGFSQGGHSALALHRLLERRHVDVTATASVGGVYDVERWFLSMLEDESTVTLPLYVSYLLLAYDDMYDVYGNRSDVFRAPYADTTPGLFDMQHYFDDVLAGLPPTSQELLQESYVNAVRSNPADPMRVRLRQNAVDRWHPEAPIRIYHSPDDEEVFYDDALVSVEPASPSRGRRRPADGVRRCM